jgi:dolichol-phosphate mannosyltransferase
MPLERVKAPGYVFMVEMCYLADCSGLRISETPVYFAERCFGKSKMSFKIQVEAALRVWIVLWKYRDLREMKKIKNKKQKD